MKLQPSRIKAISRLVVMTTLSILIYTLNSAYAIDTYNTSVADNTLYDIKVVIVNADEQDGNGKAFSAKDIEEVLGLRVDRGVTKDDLVITLGKNEYSDTTIDNSITIRELLGYYSNISTGTKRQSTV